MTLQGFTLLAITGEEKTLLRREHSESQWTMKYRSRALGQGACLEGMSRAITMQGFTITAITGAEKT